MEHNENGQPDLIRVARAAAGRILPGEADRLDAVADRARGLDQQVRRLVQEYPAATVLGAVAVGFLVGRLLRR